MNVAKNVNIYFEIKVKTNSAYIVSELNEF